MKEITKQVIECLRKASPGYLTHLIYQMEQYHDHDMTLTAARAEIQSACHGWGEEIFGDIDLTQIDYKEFAAEIWKLAV